MTIAVDTRYRSIRLEWLNNSYRGNELVQLFVRPSGGAWSLAGTFAIAGDDQLTSWDTALPVTLYDVALRYLNQTTPAVGYESTNPDLWTAATAAQSKSTVTTTSAPVSWVSGVYYAITKNVALTWASAQLGVPYLLEKFVGGVWVTVVSGITANVYVYAVPVGEQGLTVPFRVTAQSGVVSGPTATLNVALVITVGTPILTATFNGTTGFVDATWTTAAGAVDYLFEKSIDGGATWATVVAVSGLSYQYAPMVSELGVVMKFRVTGRNSGVLGTPSNVQTVTPQRVPPQVVQGFVTTYVYDLNGNTNEAFGYVLSSVPGATGADSEWSTDGVTWQGYTATGYQSGYVIVGLHPHGTRYFRFYAAYPGSPGTYSGPGPAYVFVFP
jgi:hypothetical protein